MSRRRGASSFTLVRTLLRVPRACQLMGMEVLGSRVEGGVLVVELRLSVNLKSLTLEQQLSKPALCCTKGWLLFGLLFWLLFRALLAYVCA